MPALVVVGAQWGDEGKGKLVDYLTNGASWAVRFQGGNNAGHTLVVGGEVTKLHLIPSGILWPHVRCCIGAGVAIDPNVLCEELDKLSAAGIEVTADRLMLDRDAQLILLYHGVLDRAREEYRGASKIGTTGRGIGPSYEDRANRSGVRIAELADLPTLFERLTDIIELRNRYLKDVLKSSSVVEAKEVYTQLERARERLLPFMGNASLALDRALRAGDRIVFEGAQGTLLDIAHGTVPFVTATHTIAGSVATGAGLGPNRFEYVLGVAKAYCTRVGSGPFPTELEDATGNQLRERGGEFGTTTGRPRRCGWLDIFALKRAVRLNGLAGLAVTKLDVLSGLDTLKICTGYRLDGQELDDVPALLPELEGVEGVYEELPGWSVDLSGARSWADLPNAAQNYLERVAELTGCPIALVSVGAERESTIVASGGDFLKPYLVG